MKAETQARTEASCAVKSCENGTLNADRSELKTELKTENIFRTVRAVPPQGYDEGRDPPAGNLDAAQLKPPARIMALEQSTLTEKNEANVGVYNATTKPRKPKRRDKSDLGPDFVAPDGGWGWLVCLAAGFSNLSTFPALQQYGLIYRQRMASLGFDAKQTTTIVNIIMALSSIIGIVNGAMFRRFTFRQVALTGAVFVFVGIFSSAFCTSFLQYVVCFSCIYGIGLGLNMTAVALAVNTYFKVNRRRATGFSWTITGLGPIVFPHVSTFLLVYYGVQGTILVFSGVALNALLCGIVLQPVLWHTKQPDAEAHGQAARTAGTATTQEDAECKYCQLERRGKRGIFSSQYLFNDDDPERPGYEITEPGTPMLARANDGWYGSRMSLSASVEKSSRLRHKTALRQISHKKPEAGGGGGGGGGGGELNGELQNGDATLLYKPNYFNREREDIDRYTSKSSVYSKRGAADEYRCTCADEKALLQKIGGGDTERRLEQDRALEALEAQQAEQQAEQLAKSKMTFQQKLVRFFDLDLLKDLTFVNLAMGMTIMMFCEMNFSVLTPFILHSYGYTNQQISLAMSLLGGMDISVRFLAPFAVERVKLDNRVLFAFGIVAIAIGRFIVTMTDSYEVTLAVFMLIGFGKGFRTIFSPLIIPSYVPLNRLPAASGLQLISNGIFSIAFGPILGMITDATSYTVTIHAINVLTAIALLLWLAESVVRRLLGKGPVPMDAN